MRLHHLGYVGPRLDILQKRFAAEGSEALGPPVDDPVQRVTVQFYREPGFRQLPSDGDYSRIGALLEATLRVDHPLCVGGGGNLLG